MFTNPFAVNYPCFHKSKGVILLDKSKRKSSYLFCYFLIFQKFSLKNGVVQALRNEKPKRKGKVL